MTRLYILQVKNLRKHKHWEWVNLHVVINLSEYNTPELALEVLLQEFELRKERDELPMEFRFVKIKIENNANCVYPKTSYKIIRNK